MVISRRGFVGAISAVSAQLLRGQDASRSPVVVRFVVTDATGHYVNGLKASEFRILEDDIPQKISTFTAGGPADQGEDVANSYTITYYADPSNHNQGFRRIKIEITREDVKRWRIKSRPGYRPGSESTNN